jgi:transposase-like protein
VPAVRVTPLATEFRMSHHETHIPPILQENAMSEPSHRAISGYVNDDCIWTYSVYDGNRREWRDVSVNRHEAEQYAAHLPEPRHGD